MFGFTVDLNAMALQSSIVVLLFVSIPVYIFLLTLLKIILLTYHNTLS